MIFGTKYNREGLVNSEPGGGPRLTETAGYIPAQKQIEQFLIAGRRLNEARKEMYDFPDGLDNGGIDPTRQPNFDLVDAGQMVNEAKERIMASKKSAYAEKIKKIQAEKAEFEEYKKAKEAEKNIPKKEE